MRRTALVWIGFCLAALFLAGCNGGDEGKFPKAGGDTVVAEDSYDEHGWKGKIAITYTDGKISAVDYEEFNKKKASKSKDEEYTDQMSASTGVTPAEAMVQLEKALVSAGSVDGVDTVSGATATTTRFKELAAKAISQKK